MIRFKLLAVLYIFSIGFCQSQETFPFVHIQKENYFDAYKNLSSSVDIYKGHEYENSFWQAYGTLSAFLGQYNKVERCYHIRDSIANQLPKTQRSIDVSESAISQLGLNEVYQEYDVVFLNESHHKSEHRAFLYNQLPHLFEAGYRFLAIEALNNHEWLDSNLVERGYPLYQKTGIYISDPVFAHVIRRAIEMGFTLIPYESESYGPERYPNQAQNIANGYSPEHGKLVVFSGIENNCKSSKYKKMGYLLREKLNLSSVNISQIVPRVQIVANQCKDFYLVESKNECQDYIIIQNQLKDTLNIPGWYRLMNFSYKSVSDFLSDPFDIPTLIQLFYLNEEDGVPVYQYLLEDNSLDNVLLAYPERGEYRLVIINDFGEEVSIVNID